MINASQLRKHIRPKYSRVGVWIAFAVVSLIIWHHFTHTSTGAIISPYEKIICLNAIPDFQSDGILIDSSSYGILFSKPQ